MSKEAVCAKCGDPFVDCICWTTPDCPGYPTPGVLLTALVVVGAVLAALWWLT
ncbi:MAG: hypothetical protein KC492_34290 [Myxococcales bacterium]|nr:hypothetical protein [Myxococcales bacterium]